MKLWSFRQIGMHRLVPWGLGSLVFACGLVLAGNGLDQAQAQGLDTGPTVQRGAVQSSPAVPETFNQDLRILSRAPEWQPGDPVVEIPRRRPPRRPEAKSQEESARQKPPLPAELLSLDPLAEFQEFLPEDLLKTFITPEASFDGVSFTGAIPPDTVGDVGLDHYIQMVNGPSGAVMTVFDKSGGPIAGPLVLSTLWTNGGPCADGLGDPIVLYDQLADRWLLSEFDASLTHLCVYISQTSDPVSGGWFLYDFFGARTVFEAADYPKYGVGPDAYYVSVNTGFGNAAPALALERDKMLIGAPATLLSFAAPPLSGFGFQALTPADVDGPTPPPASSSDGIFMRHRDAESHTVMVMGGLFDGGGWQQAAVDMSLALGSPSVVVRFSFDTDDALFNPFEGFFVDDVTVSTDGAVVLSDNFETGPGGWTGTGLWHLTTTCSSVVGGHSQPTSFYYGQDVSCDYETGAANAGTLDSPVLDLSGGSATTATLSFNYFLATEVSCPFDAASVEISTDGGATFTPVVGNCLPPPTGPVADPDVLEIWTLHPDFADPAAATFTGPTNIPVSEFDSALCGGFGGCFPQPGTFNTLDPLREVIMHRVQYRNLGTHESLVGNFTVDVDGADQGGIRWYELRKMGSGPWSLHQEGSHAPDTDNRWMGSIALDGAGNIALGYSVSSETTFPSIRYAGRLPIDPPGTLPIGEVSLVEGGDSQTFLSRWGDYSSMNVDPVDDCTFWYTNEYIPANGGEFWRTRIGKFSFPACGNWEEVPGGGVTPAGPEVLFYQGHRWIFIRGTDDRIYYNTQTAGTWSGWLEVPGGGATLSRPGAAVFNGELYLFVHGTDDRIYVNRLTAGGWTGWLEVPGGGATLSGPAAAVWNGNLHLFVHGLDNRIYHNTQSTGMWSGWSEVPGGGATLSAPRAVVFESVLYVVVHGTDNRIYDNLLTFGGWSGWLEVPGLGATLSGLGAAVHAGGLDYFAQGTDDRIYRNRLTSGGGVWTGWSQLPGDWRTIAGPGAAANGTECVVVRGADNRIYIHEE